MTTTETAPTVAPAAPMAPAPTQDRTLSVLALVTGVVSVVFGQTFIVPIVAIVLGVLGYQREPAGRTMAIWGAVLGGIMLFGWSIFALVGALFFVPFIPFIFF